jgi:S-DNA-T family DNA segregation ATPase FtsK/SpoIIIE
LWLSLIFITVAGLARAAVFVAVQAIRHPITAAALVLVGAAYLRSGLIGVVALGGLVLVLALIWRTAWPLSWRRWVAQPVRGWWRWQLRYRRLWYPALHGSGLTITTPDRQVYVPTVTRVTSTAVVDTLHVRLLHGHTPADLSAKAEGLRHSFACHRAVVVEDAPGRIRVILYSRDPLTKPVAALNPADVPNLSGLPVGLAEDGTPYLLTLLGTHLLVAGATGAGKGSVLWSTLRALGPGIASGLVRVTGIDPKGGMELYPGRPLFTWYADESPQAMADALTAAAERMTARKFRMRAAGQRDHHPAVGDPFELIVIDELAFLTAYLPDKKLRDQIRDALTLLLSQGRAVGYCVIAALQDPRKDVVPFRDLFPTRIALRLTEDSHVDMVLGDGALERGAACHLIPATLPGVGFVHVEGAHEPVRVRFTWITDDHITDMAATWPAPPLDHGARVIDLRDHTGRVPDQRNAPAPKRGGHPEGGELA